MSSRSEGPRPPQAPARRAAAAWVRLNRLPLIASAIGVLLMALAILWRVNPVEGSVLPRFLRESPAGAFLLTLLLAACMPVWLLLGAVLPSGGLPISVVVVLSLLAQGCLYFLLGKLVVDIGKHLDGQR